VETYKVLIQAKDKFSKQFSKATAGLKKIGGAAKSVGKVIGGLGLAVAGAAAAFVALGNKAFQALDDIGKTADRTGIAAEKLQALRLGAVESGGSVEDLNKSIEKFAKNIGDVVVKGTGEATYALDRMGIQLRDNSGHLKTNDQLLDEVVGGIGKLGSESEKASILQSLFGRAGIKLNQVFGEGAEGMAMWIKKATEMGIIIDAKAIKAVENFNDRFAELKFMVGALVNQTFAALAPVLETLITDFKDWATETHGATGAIKNMGRAIAIDLVEGLATAIDSLGGAIRWFRETGIWLDTISEKWSNAFNFDISGSERTKRLEQIRKEQADALASLDEFGTLTEEITSKLRSYGKSMLEVVETTKKLRKETDDVKVGLSTAAESLEKFGSGFDLVFNNGVNNFEDMAKLGEQVGKTLEKGLTDAFMNIGKGGEALRDLMDNILKQIVAELIKVYIVQAAITGLKTAFSFPGEATGGPVTGGKTYLVGERGPELFTPPGNGNIVPNNMMGSGGGSTNINITYDIKAFDAQSATAAIAEQAPTIVGIVEQSFRKRGRRGPLGA
jgi:hypothetical protein